jgi:hypothetical protein
MKKTIMLAFILVMPLFNDNLFSQENNNFYIYKTCQDLLKNNKILYGTYKSEGNDLKFKLDSAGKKIKIDIIKMGVFGYNLYGRKHIGKGDFIGGNKYVIAAASFVVKAYDEDGYAENIYSGLSPGPWWGIWFDFYKIDANGNPESVNATKRDNVLGKFEYISTIETLLREYPPMYEKYMSEINGIYKKNDPTLYVTWMMKYYKTYAETLKADMEKKRK